MVVLSPFLFSIQGSVCISVETPRRRGPDRNQKTGQRKRANKVRVAPAAPPLSSPRHESEIILALFTVNASFTRSVHTIRVMILKSRIIN